MADLTTSPVVSSQVSNSIDDSLASRMHDVLGLPSDQDDAHAMAAMDSHSLQIFYGSRLRAAAIELLRQDKEFQEFYTEASSQSAAPQAVRDFLQKQSGNTFATYIEAIALAKALNVDLVITDVNTDNTYCIHRSSDPEKGVVADVIHLYGHGNVHFSYGPSFDSTSGDGNNCLYHAIAQSVQSQAKARILAGQVASGFNQSSLNSAAPHSSSKKSSQGTAHAASGTGLFASTGKELSNSAKQSAVGRQGAILSDILAAVNKAPTPTESAKAEQEFQVSLARLSPADRAARKQQISSDRQYAFRVACGLENADPNRQVVAVPYSPVVSCGQEAGAISSNVALKAVS